MKRFFSGAALMAAMFMMPMMAGAQDKVEASVGADLVSNYVWRGMKLGDAAIQPCMSVSYKGFSFEAWGSYGLTSSDDTKEVDLTLSYTTGGLTVAVTDYFVEGAGSPKYFMYETHKTGHTFEANVGYDFDIFSVNAYVNFAGNDFNVELDENGEEVEKRHNNYSTYLEVSAPFALGGLDWTATVGVVPMESKCYDTDGFAVTNVTLQTEKELKISNTFSLPVFGAVTANPCTENVYLTFGVTF